MKKRRRNAWTDYPEDLKGALASNATSTSSAHLDPLRSMLLKVLSTSKTERLDLVDLVRKLKSVSDEALVETLQEAERDGIVTLKGNTVGLTTLGHRASMGIR